jgi:hypothetical protein
MRKAIPMTLLSCLLSPLMAQDQFSEKGQLHAPATYATLRTGSPGTQYYLETFEEGLGSWTATTHQGSVHWKWTDTGPGPTPSFYHVPPLGTTPGWAIIDDDHDGHPGHTCNASLTSPVIDLSGAPPVVKLQFDQYYQEYLNDNAYVGISTDGGASWNEVEINQGVGRQNRPNPETVIMDLAPLVAANPANVRIRFRYHADWSYGWQIDNVGIYEPPPVELVLERAETIHAGSGTSYGRLALAQFGEEIHAVAHVKNGGSLPLNNVVVHLEIRDPDGMIVLSESSGSLQLDPWDTATVHLYASFEPATEGIHGITFTAASDESEEEEDPENNVLVRYIKVDPLSCSLDGIGVYPAGTSSVAMIGTNSFENAEDGLYLMTHYPVHAPMLVRGIQLQLHSGTVAGGFVHAALYDSIRVMNGQIDLSIAESPLHDITQADVAAGHIDLVFAQPVLLENGSFYAAVALNSISGSAHIQVMDDLTLQRPPLASLIYVAGNGGYNNGNAVAVRLLLDPDMVSVAENPPGAGIMVHPNPGNGIFTLETGSMGSGSLEGHDITGALVHAGRFNERTVVDLAHLRPAVYLLTLRNDKDTMTLRLAKE